MHLLISNDDGIHAEGIQILASALASIGKITVIAPDRNRSGAGHSLTLNTPLRVNTHKNEYKSVTGTPTDCVHLACTGLLKTPPDFVCSGINDRGNLGDDVLYSGTVAAAVEGCLMGLPSLAISLVTRPTDPVYYFETAAFWADYFIHEMMRNSLPKGTILNINVPNLPKEEIAGCQVTRLGSRHKAEHIIAQKDPRGLPIYWIGPPGKEQDAGVGTDFYAVNQKQVSVTPIKIDFTHNEAVNQLKKWFNKP